MRFAEEKLWRREIEQELAEEIEELMGWVEITDTPALHDCELPSNDEVRERHAGRDSVWECDICQQRWKMYNVSRSGVPSWSEESDSGFYRIQIG
jgi:hypothetical protein